MAVCVFIIGMMQRVNRSSVLAKLGAIGFASARRRRLIDDTVPDVLQV
jgi:hypothetical protein